MATRRSNPQSPVPRMAAACLVLVLVVFVLLRSGLIRSGIPPSVGLSLPGLIPARMLFEDEISITGTPPLEVRASVPDVRVTPEGDVSWPGPEPGVHAVVFTVRNAVGEAQAVWRVAVVAEPVRIVSPPRTEAAPRRPYEYPVAVRGAPPFEWELPQAPDGMTVDEHGVVRMPADRMAEGAEFAVTVRVANTVADRQQEDTQTFTLRCRKAEKPEKKRRQMKVASMTREKAQVPTTPASTPPQPPEEKQPDEENEPTAARRREEERERQEQARLTAEDREELEEARRREMAKRRLEEEKARREAEAEQHRKREEERQRQREAREAQLARAREAREREEAHRLERERLQREQAEKDEKLRRQEEERERSAEEQRRIEQERLREEQKRAKAEAERREREARAKREAEMRRLREEARRRQEQELRAQREEQRRQQQARERLEAEQERLRAERARREQEAAKRAADEAARRQQAEARRRDDDALAQKVDEGRKVEFSWYRFVFDGSLAEFVELAARLNIMVLFVALEGEALDLDRTPYVVTGVDGTGRPLARAADGAGMSRRLGSGYNLKGVRLVAVANGPDWANVDTRLGREKGVSGHWTLAFFPYALIADLARSAQTFYADRRTDRSLPFERGAGRITFTVRRDGNVEILSMANTR